MLLDFFFCSGCLIKGQHGSRMKIAVIDVLIFDWTDFVPKCGQ